MELSFHIGSIKANGIAGSASLNIGQNLLIGFNSTNKSAQGNSVNGDQALIPGLATWVDDRDLVDTPFWEAG